jgi:hypothetical protein
LFRILTVSRLTAIGVATAFSTSAADAPVAGIAGAMVSPDSIILDSILSNWRLNRVLG